MSSEPTMIFRGELLVSGRVPIFTVSSSELRFFSQGYHTESYLTSPAAWDMSSTAALKTAASWKTYFTWKQWRSGGHQHVCAYWLKTDLYFYLFDFCTRMVLRCGFWGSGFWVWHDHVPLICAHTWCSVVGFGGRVFWVGHDHVPLICAHAWCSVVVHS